MPKKLSNHAKIRRRKYKIFLVDDEAAFLRMYGLKLKLFGFDVEVCDKSSECVKNILKFKPDLIFLDLVMSKQDGLQILKKLKSSIATKWMPVVMLTNIDNPADKEACIKAGASDYLVKIEHTPAELAEYAKEVLRLI